MKDLTVLTEEQLKEEKLRAEIRELGRPFHGNATFWYSCLMAGIAILSTMFVLQQDVAAKRLAATEREIILIEAEKLIAATNLARKIAEEKLVTLRKSEKRLIRRAQQLESVTEPLAEEQLRSGELNDRNTEYAMIAAALSRLKSQRESLRRFQREGSSSQTSLDSVVQYLDKLFTHEAISEAIQAAEPITVP
jgi:hypothetical protein